MPLITPFELIVAIFVLLLLTVTFLLAQFVGLTYVFNLKVLPFLIVTFVLFTETDLTAYLNGFLHSFA